MVPINREREEEYRNQMADQFRFQDIDTIADMIGENMEGLVITRKRLEKIMSQI